MALPLSNVRLLFPVQARHASPNVTLQARSSGETFNKGHITSLASERGVALPSSPLFSWCASVVLFLIAAIGVQATPPPPGVAPVLTPAGGFGIEGDLLARQPSPGSGDWVTAANLAGTGEGVLSSGGIPLNPGTTFHFTDPFNDRTHDLIFTGGSKWTDNPNTWNWVAGKPSSKTDLNNLLLHVATDLSGHTWLALAADRSSAQGDSYIDFELLQNPIVRTNSGQFISYGPDGGRTVNDLLLSLGFTGGGKVADFLVWRWEPDGSGGFHYVDRTAALPGGHVFVALNTNSIPVPYSAFGATTYPSNAFVEAAIDMTAMVEGVEACEQFGFVAIMVKTKASSSDSAGIEDFLDPIAFDFRVGPLADAGEDQTVCSGEAETLFNLTGSASAGLAPVISNHWSVISGTATITSPHSLATTVFVASPTATLRLDTLQENGCTDFDEVVLTKITPPPADITGSSTLCPDSMTEYSAPAGLDSYGWSLTGNATIAGSTNSDTVTVISGSTCGEGFVLSLVVSSNICTVTSSAEVLVDDDTPPVLTAGDDRIVECGLAWDFDPVSALDDCAETNNVIPVIVSTTITPLIGETFSATRIWQATDPCGNTAFASQTITIVDTTPPQIACPTGVVVECAGPAGTEAVFDVPAWDICDSNVVVVCTPPSGTLFPFGDTPVTCTATDDSGNTSQCSFVVTVQDTTPPEIFCPANITQNTDPGLCEAVLDPGLATATDICDDASVVGVRSDALLLTDPYPKGDTYILWTATDAVGLTNTCTQTITVIDNEPPDISCPQDLITTEWPWDSGFASVEFPTPLATDNCSPGPEVACTPASGSSFPLGETVVQCVATDSSGNTNSCSFTVRVIPYRLTVDNTNDSGPGSLRQALIDANASIGANLIEFAFPGDGPYTIQLLSALPAITSPVTVDGWSQIGFVIDPMIELNGGLATGAIDGLVFSSPSNTIRGLALYDFNAALKLEGPGGNIVQGVSIGVDSTGTNTIGNTGDGLLIASPNNIVGGSGPGEANVISGNGANGIRLTSSLAVGNKIIGNLIGVAPDGFTPVPNGGAGVFIEEGASNNMIGAFNPAEANRIQSNAGAGIATSQSAGTGNRFGVNFIDENGGLGIDLGNDGVTPNDADDSDSGPNGGQNFPILLDARSANGVTVVDGSLMSVPNQVYRLDFYLNDEADPTGYGEGWQYLGFAMLPVGVSGTSDFSVSFETPAVFTQFVTATATDPFGNSSEFSEAIQVRTPPVAGLDPSGTNTTAGSSVTLCADASGTPPIFYQWRRNGANIPGETNQCITLTGLDAQDAGAYSVIVYNDLGGFGTPPAAVLVPPTNSVPAHDNFADRLPLPSLSGESQWSSRSASREGGEPLHAGKPGGHSVWYSWVAPEKGIATIGTRGSTFDTLLGVYTGSNVSNLTEVARDEDRGGYFTSGLRFNAIKGEEYAIAIDGYFGESGDFVLGWSFEDTPHLLPIFVQQPQSQTVQSNGTAVFTCDVARVCGNGVTNCPDPKEYPNGVIPGLAKQWLFQGVPISGATNSTLVISNVQPANVGAYVVEATAKYDADGVSRTVRSDVADLQINQTGTGGLAAVQAKDKFKDTLLAPPWLIGGLVPTAPIIGETSGGLRIAAAGGLTSGYTGTQIFNTVDSSSSSDETLLCDVPGGSSEWVTLVSQADGMLTVNTAGSSYDTILAIYLLTPTNPVPQMIACNDDSIPGAVTTSELTIPIKTGDTNTILVDGKYGATGTLVLNYSLIGPAFLQAGGMNDLGAFGVQVLGYPGMKFRIESSSDLSNWTPLVSTNSAEGVFDYNDASAPASVKYYRAVLLP